MNWLSEKLPESITVHDKEYPIDANFRNCLVIIQAFESENLLASEKLEVLFNRLYEVELRDFPKEDIQQAMIQGVRFLDCNDQIQTTGERRLYSFESDGMYIRSAIEKSHRVRLEEVQFLHWWEFVYMFIDLDDCAFTQIQRLRYNHYKGKLTKEERQYIQKNPSVLLEHEVDEEQKKFEDDILARAKAQPKGGY